MNNIVLSSNYKTMIDGAVRGGLEYLTDHPNLKALVIGISGGIDSAVTAALARQVCDRIGWDVKLVGYSLPIVGNADEEIQRAEMVGKALCDEFQTKDLSEAMEAATHVFDSNLYERYMHGTTNDADRIALGNLKARTRMMYLYHQAGIRKGMVLSTDNYTELQLGFWTLHGDVGDFGFIQNLWKSEVYGVAEALGEPLTAFVDAKPTDGLGVTDSDLDQLLPGWTPAEGESWRDGYKLVDVILSGYLMGTGAYPHTHPVIVRHLATGFKRENPVNLKRDFLLWRHNAG